MCGLVAIYGKQAACKIEQAVKHIEHRGLRTTVRSGKNFAIAHCRLPIVGVDPVNDQPVSTGKWTIGFVGELLDFREMYSGMDCDVCLVEKIWTEDGPFGFYEQDGFWHVVAANEEEMCYLTDYLSQKPLYVREGEDWTAVSSELDPLVAIDQVNLDEVYLSSVIKWGYCPETYRTPYKHIRQVLPGVCEQVKDGERNKWHSDLLGPKHLEEEDFKEEIIKAIKRRVVSSDVPVAILVSGGLDSSIVYTIASRYGDVKAYHVENNEAESCNLVAPDAKLLDWKDVTTDKALKYMQEPLDLGSLLPQVALSDAIANSGNERVCLTGDGADEFFGGYERSKRYDSQWSDVWQELINWHLPRLDRVMMRNCIEVRSPFLARRVAGAALSLPHLWRIDKRFLRYLFRKELPDRVIWREKKALKIEACEFNREERSSKLVADFVKIFTKGEK
jgi:asparagine synthase (glutamine-hydrolysing)